jgi:diaminopimelate epimerase
MDMTDSWCHHPRMKFFKYHGTGNDFLVVDARQGRPEGLDASAVQLICDRHFGVGGDGILLVEAGDLAPWFMRVLNSDGSEAEMCGNGIRCVARFISDHLGHAGDEIPIQTPAGIRMCSLTRDGDGQITSVSVSMGAPILDRKLIPMTGSGTATDASVCAKGREFQGLGVNMGNPHFVIFEYLDSTDGGIFGATLTSDPVFPAGANIEFAGKISDRHFKITVFERGCGLTMACGTGASATVVAAVLTGRAPAGVPVQVDLPGGPLFITVATDMSDVILKGPAAEVFQGQIDLSALTR